ncbi:MAG TPA: glutathione S-transferase family protein [Solirubrobacterales bacterium]|nr:glutathione S-transferase family protein [Solirubrobacterales bacterium]
MTAIIQIYYMPRTRSNRVLWALHEIGAPFESTRIAPEDRRSPEHLARHPLGRVPAFEFDDGTVIFESAAILLQLGDMYPDSGLLPAPGTTERALVYQWLMFGMTELEGPLYRWLTARREGTEDSASSERFTAAAEAIAAALDGKAWLLGDRFTLADIVCVGVLGSADSRGLLEPWPVLHDYVTRGEARPAHLAAVAFAED